MSSTVPKRGVRGWRSRCAAQTGRRLGPLRFGRVARVVCSRDGAYAACAIYWNRLDRARVEPRSVESALHAERRMRSSDRGGAGESSLERGRRSVSRRCDIDRAHRATLEAGGGSSACASARFGGIGVKSRRANEAVPRVRHRVNACKVLTTDRSWCGPYTRRRSARAAVAC